MAKRHDIQIDIRARRRRARMSTLLSVFEAIGGLTILILKIVMLIIMIPLAIIGIAI